MDSSGDAVPHSDWYDLLKKTCKGIARVLRGSIHVFLCKNEDGGPMKYKYKTYLYLHFTGYKITPIDPLFPNHVSRKC